MAAFLHNVFVDPNAFWVGFLAGALFTWILYRLRGYLPASLSWIKRIFASIRVSLSRGTEHRLRNDIVKYAQKQHLTSMICSLDEIIIEPTLMIPPVQVSFGNQTLPIDTVNLTIPYIPDWPELGGTYRTPTISVFKILNNHANIALVGNPGSGKTVTLSYIASEIARRSPQCGGLGNLLPIFIHALDIEYTPDTHQSQGISTSQGENIPEEIPGDLQFKQLLIRVLTDAVSRQGSPLTQPRLPNIIQTALSSEKVIILIDGLDELPPNDIHPRYLYIKALLDKYPNIQVVASVSFENLAGLPSLGFHVYSMAAWSDAQKNGFVKKWQNLWKKIDNASDSRQTKKVNSYAINAWLTAPSIPCTPFDMTLKVWAAYSGDLLGSDSPSALEAYVRRMTVNQSKARAALEHLALNMIISMNPAMQPHQSDTIPIADGEEQIPSTNIELENTDKQEVWKGRLASIWGDLSNTGLLQDHSASRLRFISPIITGYLAGKALLKHAGLLKIQDQPSWVGKSTTLYYLASMGDVSSVVQYLLKRDDFLHSEQLRIGRWLSVAAKNQPWRSLVLRTLVSALKNEKDTLPLAARIITALSISGDPGVSILFRQMLQSENNNLRQLSALACGIISDFKAVDELSRLMADSSPMIIRSASLALVAIGDKRALERIAISLLHGTELNRRAAAEALANHPLKGYPTLYEGSTADDLRVRHAVVYGLMRIQQPWAKEVLDKLQLEDNEWIVRTAAIQALEEINLPGAHVPNPLPDLTETPWLIDYAAKQGMGVAPGEPAYELLLDALKNGKEEEKLKALYYLSFHGNAQAIPIIYSWYFGGTGDIRDTAYQTLWILFNSGITLPSPQQFGF